jgi:hypothetical protein
VRTFAGRAAAEWFTAKPAVPEKISVTVFKVRIASVFSRSMCPQLLPTGLSLSSQSWIWMKNEQPGF